MRQNNQQNNRLSGELIRELGTLEKKIQETKKLAEKKSNKTGDLARRTRKLLKNCDDKMEAIEKKALKETGG